MKYRKHLFICTNQRANTDKKSCGTEHGEALVAQFKELIKKNNLQIDIRAQKTACLDACLQGPSMVVYPEAVWYGNVQLEDVTEIFEEHLLNNRPVERLQLVFPTRKTDA
jgi:(2Fe-2S) ferredoxin